MLRIAANLLNWTINPTLIRVNSLLGIVKSGPGLIFTNTVTFTTTGAQKVNIFKLNGRARVLGLTGTISGATAITNVTDIYFDLWDGTASTVITKKRRC